MELVRVLWCTTFLILLFFCFTDLVWKIKQDPKNGFRVCSSTKVFSAHFTLQDFVNPESDTRRLKGGACPSVFCWVKSMDNGLFTFAKKNHMFKFTNSVLQCSILTTGSRAWTVHRTQLQTLCSVTCYTLCQWGQRSHCFDAQNELWQFENDVSAFLCLFGMECGLWFKGLKGLYSPRESLKCMANCGDGNRRNEVLVLVLVSKRVLPRICCSWTSSMKKLSWK